VIKRDKLHAAVPRAQTTDLGDSSKVPAPRQKLSSARGQGPILDQAHGEGIVYAPNVKSRKHEESGLLDQYIIHVQVDVLQISNAFLAEEPFGADPCISWVKSMYMTNIRLALLRSSSARGDGSLNGLSVGIPVPRSGLAGSWLRGAISSDNPHCVCGSPGEGLYSGL
jgi:hypothetical protein